MITTIEILELGFTEEKHNNTTFYKYIDFPKMNVNLFTLFKSRDNSNYILRFRGELISDNITSKEDLIKELNGK